MMTTDHVIAGVSILVLVVAIVSLIITVRQARIAVMENRGDLQYLGQELERVRCTIETTNERLSEQLAMLNQAAKRDAQTGAVGEH
jgi:hypothetical protein